MQTQDNIIYLAQANSKGFAPRREEEVDKTLPYFQIQKNDIGKYSINTFNYETHDNAPRMDMWSNYLTTSIFPNVDPNINISGFYNIELHDSYTYLKNNKNYKNVFTFSKFKHDPSPILIPDPYMICNWGNSLNSLNDDQDWDKKMNKVCFYGTTTGIRDPFQNERIKLCLWARDKRQYCDFYITNVAQMSLDDFKKVNGFDDIYHQRVTMEQQSKYKYHLMIDGNTCRFDVWHFKMNNVIFKYPSNEMLWYYPFLQDDNHYVEVNKDNIFSKMQFFNSNPLNAQCMIFNAKKLGLTLFRPLIHQIYTINLFETMAMNS
jgi:hypothetical protein